MNTTRREKRREHREDGIYEITVEVVGERRLPKSEMAVELIEATLRSRLEEIFARRGSHNSGELLRELALRIVDQIEVAGLLVD